VSSLLRARRDVKENPARALFGIQAHQTTTSRQMTLQNNRIAEEELVPLYSQSHNLRRMSPISPAYVRQALANAGISTLDPLAKTEYARADNADSWA
jgi:hypothetical protein